jgi:hypothetical protein
MLPGGRHVVRSAPWLGKCGSLALGPPMMGTSSLTYGGVTSLGIPGTWAPAEVMSFLLEKGVPPQVDIEGSKSKGLRTAIGR